MSSRPFACLSLLTFLLLLLPPSARGDETVILNIVLNQENKGEYYLILRTDGDYFIKADDLIAIGFKEVEGEVYDIEGELYVLLGTIRGVSFQLNEETLSLEITALPFHFAKQVIDFQRRRPGDIRYRDEISAFLNYNLQYTETSSTPSLGFFNEAGARRGHWLFLSDTEFTRIESEDRFVRLMTNLTYDRRKHLQRLVIGDSLTPANPFVPSLNMGGIRFYKAYDTAPDLITHPLIHYSGNVTMPSEIDIYLDGRYYRTEKIRPGEYDFRNLFPREGGGALEIVLRDAFGREDRLVLPYYLTTALLSRGYHDYSYSLGFVREEFGTRSFDYGDAAFSGFHRYGVNDYVTVGLAGETLKGRFNFSPSGQIRLWNAGVATVIASVSRNGDSRMGWADFVDYSYQSRHFNFQFQTRRSSREYSSVTDSPSDRDAKFQWQTGAGYNTQTLGSMGITYEMTRRFDDSSLKAATARYSRSLYYRVRMILSLRYAMDEDTSREFFINFLYSPFRKTTVSASYDRLNGSDTETLAVENAPPIGEGLGGRAVYKRTDSDTESTNAFDGFLQYNGRYGAYLGRYRNDGTNRDYQLSTAGSLAYSNGIVSVGRPVTDSFAVVEVGDLENVRVYVNNNEIGRTDSSGRLYVPELASYYNNQVSINDQDVPMEYSFPDSKLFASPPGRSGSRLSFEASKYQGIFGKILVRTPKGVEPARLYEIEMVVEGRPVTFQTTGDGEFYVENLLPGTYAASFTFRQRTCSIDLVIPETDETLIDLGDVVCDQDR